MQSVRNSVAVIVSILVFTLLSGSTGLADWDSTEPAKWVQWPDLTPNGVDVAFGEGDPDNKDFAGSYILADDFPCTSSNHVTDIHVFCSWFDDYQGEIGEIRVSIWSDWPEDAAHLYSTPSNELWSITLPMSDPRWTIQPIVTVPEGEWWWDPAQPLGIHPGDWTVYQLNIFLDPTNAFLQLGSPDQTNIYWLALQVTPLDPTAQIGWKTRDPTDGHYMDDAVWSADGGLNWGELRYPPNHPYAEMSIDFSYVLTSDTDFGDAPDAPYPTLRASNGARHQIVPGVFLGATVDGEGDGQPSPGADGDDLNGAVPDDEDGVVFISPLVAGSAASIQVTASTPGTLNGWIDFNTNGVWGDSPGEDLWPGGTNVPAGMLVHAIVVPGNAALAGTYARFRFNSGGVSLTPSGPAFDGEVEDYALTIFGEEPIDFGDAPDPTYPTLLASGGARHTIVPGFYLGASVDAEADGQPHAFSLGDDLAGSDDEDGVVFLTPLVPGRTGSVQVTSSAIGKLDAWIDYNRNGTWSGGEQLRGGSIGLSSGINIIPFSVPTWAQSGLSHARFRLTLMGGSSPIGPEPEGEVEDCWVRIDKGGNPYDLFPGMCPTWLRPPDCNTGIDVASWMSIPPAGLTPWVADDWLGDGRPMKAIAWWGSYIGSQSSSPDPALPPAVGRPMAFELTWWTDQPVGAYSNSMPLTLLASNVVALAPYSTTNVPNGAVQESYYCTSDLTPLGQSGTYEHEYLYCLVLTNRMWEPIGKDGDIYWLGIRALYSGYGLPGNPWGWKTTHIDDNWQDDAVRWTNGIPGWEELRYPPPGWSHLDHPWSNRSVNTAFALYTDVCGRRSLKWHQPPDMDEGENMPSWTTDGAAPQGPGDPLRADDFISDGRRITDVHWWGSYLEWEWDNPEPVKPPSVQQGHPIGFWLSWHADIPIDPTGAGYSMPSNPPLKRFFVPIDKCNEVYYGPVLQYWKEPPQWEHEYQYYVDLLDREIESGPWSETNGVIYWLDIQAVFPVGWHPEQGVHLGWGWKTTDPINQWNDLSVVATNYAPDPLWQPGSYPTNHLPYGWPPPGAPMDLAFELTTDEPASSIWYGPIVITGIWAKVTNSPETSLVVSYGTSGAGTQYLESCDNLLVTNWVVVTNNPLPLPPPWTNKWRPDISVALSNRFWRVVER